MLSLWPGYAVVPVYLLVPLVSLMTGILGVLWLFCVIRISCHQKKIFVMLLILPLVVMCTLGALKFYLPRRTAFTLCRPAFEKRMSSVPLTSRAVDCDGTIGIYSIDSWGKDPRGGVYFRTTATNDFLGPDEISYGFVYKPNPHGSPFGGAEYRLYPLGGEWYWFKANNDWY